MKMEKVLNPYTLEEIGEVPLQSKEEVHAALVTARQTFLDRDRWLKKYEMAAILERTVEIMKGRIEELTAIAAGEGGKPYIDSKVEVQRAINGVQLALEEMGHFGGREIPMGHTLSSANRMGHTFKEPIGVVASISAFNHPLNLSVHQIIPALAVGCPVIIKPALTTPMSCLNFVEILYEAGLPKNWCQVITCDIPEAEYLATSEMIDYLSFIGSAGVGWYLRSKIAPGVRIGLEHGGVAPVIVEPDAKLDDLLPALAKGGFYHAGQVCVSVQRIFVHNSILDEVASRLSAIAKELVVGDPLDPKTEVGPIILTNEVNRIHNWVTEAVNSGGELLCGGERVGTTCYAPTVVKNPPKDCTLSTREIFGPVVAIYGYDALDEAIAAANALEVSFQAAIFTQNIDTAMYAVKRLNGTAVMVNDHTAFRVDWMPFGGAKASGLGMGGIPYSMEEMSTEKLMVIKSPAL